MREKFIKVLIGFMIMMAVITLVSRGANALTIPRVTTGSPEKRNITHTVTASGYFTHNKVIPVTTEGGIRIRSVEVDEGSRVNAGEPLMYLDSEDLAGKIADAEYEAEKTRLSLQDAIANRQLAANRRSAELNRASEDYQNAVNNGNQLVGQARTEMVEAEARWNAAKEAPDLENEQVWAEEVARLEAAYYEKKSIYEQAVRDSEANEKEASRKLADARMTPESDSSAEQLEQELARKEEELRELRELQEQDGAIISPVNGTVTEAAAATGELTSETKAFLISDDSSGVIFAADISREDQKNISIGEAASVILANGEVVEGLNVDRITKNKEESGILTITVVLPAREDIYLQDQGALKIEKSTKAYDICVPLEVLREEEGKKYLLLVKEKETALGIQLEAVKQEVEVLDKNDKYAAIEGSGLTSEELYIEDSDRVVQAGDIIRLQKE